MGGFFFWKNTFAILNRMTEITIYCDGSSIGNPGPGGWGAVIADKARAKEVGGYELRTTNNRMELTAAIEALKLLKQSRKVSVHTDSRYVINGITKWVFGWEKKGWITTGKTDVVNKELWQELMEVAKIHDVTWKHVKGHSGDRLNERADVIANGYARKEKVELYSGPLSSYEKFLEGMPKPRVVSKSKKTKNVGKAYSYVSVLEGVVKVHATWAECEARVKGKRAKFKKALSASDEASLIEGWKKSKL